MPSRGYFFIPKKLLHIDPRFDIIVVNLIFNDKMNFKIQSTAS
nr:MAG TPA: hypothetical protein [Caudoviricetes sp.]